MGSTPAGLRLPARPTRLNGSNGVGGRLTGVLAAISAGSLEPVQGHRPYALGHHQRPGHNRDVRGGRPLPGRACGRCYRRPYEQEGFRARCHMDGAEPPSRHPARASSAASLGDSDRLGRRRHLTVSAS